MRGAGGEGGAMLLRALPSLALEQTPEGGQEYKGQSQGRGGGKASTITEVILAAGSSGCVLGVAVVHSLKAAGHTGLAHLHPGRGVVCRGGKAGQDPERGQPKHAGPLGQDPLCLGLPERILEQVGASLFSLPHSTLCPAPVLPRESWGSIPGTHKCASSCSRRPWPGSAWG